MSRIENFTLPNFNMDDVIIFCQRIGFCLMQLQSFERSLAYYIVPIQKIDTGLEREAIDNLYHEHSKLTLGVLFQKVQKCDKLPEDLRLKIENFIKERNWLVHRVFNENHSDVYDPMKFEKLMARIDNLAEEAITLRKIYLEKADEYLIKNKIVTREKLNTLTQQILDSWRPREE
jgi:hypothetical protein